MAKVRHSDRPERRRRSYRRLAFLAMLALGSNLGCGRELLRVPAVSKTPPPIPADVPAALAAAAARRPKAMKPVAIRTIADYGSTLDELFPTTYRDPRSYGPHLAGTAVPRPLEHGRFDPGDLMAASQSSKIPLPKPVRSAPRPAAGPPAVSEAPPAGIAGAAPDHRQGDRDPLREASHDSRIPPPIRPPAPASPPQPAQPVAAAPQAPPTSTSAFEATRIAPPRPPAPPRELKLPDLEQASSNTGIAMPVAPTRRPAEPAIAEVAVEGEASPATRGRVEEPEPQRVEPASAFDVTSIAPPIPPEPSAGPPAAVERDPSEATGIAPPIPPQASVEPAVAAEQDAFDATSIAPPVPPRADATPPAAADNNASDAAKLAPPLPPLASARPPAAVGHDAFDLTKIPPPVPASEQPSEPRDPVPESELPPPLQLDPSLFQQVPGAVPGLPPPLPPVIPVAAAAPPDAPIDPAGLAAACQATRIAPPTPTPTPTASSTRGPGPGQAEPGP